MLPKAGGLLDQDEDTVKRMLLIYSHLEDWREIEMDRTTKQATTPPPERPRG